MSVKDRTGEVWDWGGRLMLIISPPRHSKHCKDDELMHEVMFLEDGMIDGVYEKKVVPWERKQGWRPRRIT